MKKDIPIKEHITAGCILVRNIDKNPKTLLIHKIWDNGLEGWFMPKGHVDDNETFEQAALRECKEETGYSDIEILKHIKDTVIEYMWDDGFMHHKTIHWYLARIISTKKVKKKLTADEMKASGEQKWFGLHEALKMMRFEHDKEVVLDVIKALSI